MSDLHDLQRELHQLENCLEQVQNSWTIDDHESLLQFYVEILPGLIGAERCSIFFVDLRQNNVWLKVGTGLKFRQIEAPLEGSVVGRAVSSGACIVENGLDQRPGFHTSTDARTGFVTRNLICVPVQSRVNSAVTAVVELLNKVHPGGFTLDDQERLLKIMRQLSMIIDNIRIQGDILSVSKQINDTLRGMNPAFLASRNIIAESRAMQEVLAFVRSVAGTPVNIFVSGENGTGKEVISRLIHDLSQARDKPFVAVNCASIPENLMESEFFGYEKGAFTGAVLARKGRFEEADGGTLFLDEIADLPLAIQPKFLRVLQEGEGSRLGSNKVNKFQFRIISATNKDIRREVAEGRFREDLYYRLFSVEVHIPPLRERPEEILPLAQAFLRETCRRFQKQVNGFSAEVMHLFESYAWPGNVRQLRREVERLVTLTPEHGVMTPENCSLELRQKALVPQETKSLLPGDATGLSVAPSDLPDQSCLPAYPLPPGDAPLKVHLQALERHCIATALQASHGSKQETARRLGITRQWLHRKMIQYQM
ncbi:MAG: sigma-54-dependent Fis family transcriptional regulator [Magnetococcus sp. DMHC-1]|nr:sigma-54-dependent Fis family transcriptional regulator [Magnetococcales bacterium]MBF0154893.1 sigma-54-dependent Fis family transcriptional regulator [Magnetococcales bacterium]